MAAQRLGLASPTDELRVALLATLRGSETFVAGVGGRIFDAERDDFPCAWVGVTASADNETLVELLATVHVWKRSGEASVSALIEEAKAVFAVPPSMARHSLLSWMPGYSEIRLYEDYAAHRGLARFHAQARLNLPSNT